MTASLVEALKILNDAHVGKDDQVKQLPDGATPAGDPLTEPCLAEPCIGNPVSHGQILDIWAQLRKLANSEYSLESLLEGSRVYIAPPPPKAEPTDQYKALMARLRRDEEERCYTRMIQRAPTHDTFSDGLASAYSFAEVNKPTNDADLGPDAISHEEVQKQITLIVNFLVSIAGCAAAVWIAARWWRTPARLFLTLGASIVVAVAEVAVYSAWSWRMAEGDKRQQRVKEVRQVVKTWVIGENGQDAKEALEPVLVPPTASAKEANLRKRIPSLS